MEGAGCMTRVTACSSQSRIERRLVAQPNRLPRAALERSDAGEGGSGRDIAVPHALTCGAALDGGNDPGAEFGVERWVEPFRPVGEHAPRKGPVRLENDVVLLGEAIRPGFADPLAANVVAIGNVDGRLDRHQRA